MNLILSRVAAFGYLASVLAQVGFWLGYNLFGNSAVILFVGIFVVWIPTILGLQRTRANFQGTDAWRQLLIGAPPWMFTLVQASFVYAMVNFALGFVGLFSMEGDGFWRVGTSHAMAFYAVAWGVATAALGREEQGIEWKCTNGHDLAPTAKFCPECGAAARTPPQEPPR